MFDNNADFYPTPRNIARAMVKAISPDARYILEPSAGMGHLADVIKQPYTWGEAEEELKETLGNPDDDDIRKSERRT